MNPFRSIIRIIDGRDPIPPKMSQQMQNDATLALKIGGAIEEAATPSPNWSALIALIEALLPVLIPLL